MTTNDSGIPQIARERLVFWGATAAVALHVADDNFVQPADGVSATDHLASGLVPLGVLALGAAAYPRVRAGARGLIALGTALVGLVVGLIEAGNHTLDGGPSGDDFTGFLAAGAGFVLIGLGTMVLWRSRRRGGSRPRRYLRRALLGVLGVAVLSELIAPFALGYLVTHASRTDVPAPDLGTAHENVTFTTSDGLELDGWYVPSQNGAAIIVPGRGSPQLHARMLIEHGYGVLLFDRRGEGASEGDANMFGWGAERDIHAAVDYLKDRSDVDPARIGGIGFSVGGELMLQAAAENPDLAAIVSEGAGTRSLAEEKVESDTTTLMRGLPAKLAQQAGIALFSNEPPPPSLVDLLPAIAPRPALIIWAPNGGNMETMNPLYQRLIGPSADIWEMDDVRHIKGLQTHPEEYEQRVVGFFDQALLSS